MAKEKEKGHRKMKKNGNGLLILGILLVVAFAIWTLLIQIIDVQPVGQNGTDLGFATFNCWFHQLTGVHMTIYNITDWLGLIQFSRRCLENYLGLIIVNYFQFQIVINDLFMKKNVLMPAGLFEN